jgi:hypothetical protein
VNLLLLFGAGFRYPCALIPWLAVVMLEHIVIGIPVIVFLGLLSLYLAAQVPPWKMLQAL